MSDKRIEGFYVEKSIKAQEPSLNLDEETVNTQDILQAQQVASHKPSEEVKETPKQTILSKPKRVSTRQTSARNNQGNDNGKSRTKKSKLQVEYKESEQKRTPEVKKTPSSSISAGRTLFGHGSFDALDFQQSFALTSGTVFKPPSFKTKSVFAAKAETQSSSTSSISTPPKQEKKAALFKGDEDGDLPLHIAIIHNHPLARTFIDLMILYGKEHDSYGLNTANNLKQTVLHLAILTCQPSVVEYLAEKGADVNVADRNGQTPLHLACKNADLDAIRALRNGTKKHNENSINLNSRNFEGFSPIHLATFTGSCEVLAELLDMGADINIKDSTSGRTALHHAVEAHNPIVIKFLLSHKADVNAQTFSGNTPLHTASGRQMDSIIKLLLESGANVLLKNSEGDQALSETHKLYSQAQRIAKSTEEKIKVG